ncbi:MAG TPA: signal recognition particle-docking protein FtsY [Planctomycetaceae bacterium]|nr:signal recognition particle-docking protein FtsY [Planctomycetaceae bacterium]
MGWFDKLKQGLQKTKQLLQTDVRDLFKAGEIVTEAQLEQFEAALIRTDLGVVAAGQVIAELRTEYLGRTVQLSDVWNSVKTTLRRLLQGTDGLRWNPEQPLSPIKTAAAKPTVILVSGVNGAGKTTTIAKLARLIQTSGHTVMLAAGDTFRAAAVEQLTLWSERLACKIVTKPSGSDPAAVAFAGCEQAVKDGVDYLIIDTAGRLHTQQNLMKELEKIRRVIDKQVPGAPHESLLVIDATTGQNGVNQAKQFGEAIHCTGIVLTKLDGTAKGGVVVAIRQQMGFPVKYVGVGEQIDDLQLFDPDSFVEALFAEG